MSELSFMCEICGRKTTDPNDNHRCGNVKAIVHKENEFVPRSGIDVLVGSCVKDVKNNIGKFAKNHPAQLDEINPKLLIVMIITNIAMNLFLDGYSATADFKETETAFHNLLQEVQTMGKQGLSALEAATADTKIAH